MKASLGFIFASSKACCGVFYQNNFFGCTYFFSGPRNFAWVTNLCTPMKLFLLRLSQNTPWISTLGPLSHPALRRWMC